jgi:Fungal specific transcription factor domain
MCLVKSYQQRQNADPESYTSIQNYRERVAQCLVTGKYMSCPPHTIETLLLLLHIEYILCQDSQTENWVLLGIIVRLAIRAGYHREPSHFPEISPFDAEMRRRTWTTIMSLDALLSLDVGLPSMIVESQYDTGDPLNLLDADLVENMIALAPSRPDDFYTPVRFLLAKNKIARMYPKISALTESIQTPPYSEVMQLDTMLNDTYSAMPQLRPTAETFPDTLDATAQRIDIAIIYQRARCILHHRYMLAGRTHKQFAYSRSTCIDAAIQILESQQMLSVETLFIGTLYQARWKVSSFHRSSFYFAATLLCLVLNDGFWSSFAESDLLYRVKQSLNSSYNIWHQEKNSFKEIQKIVKAIEVVLGKALNTAIAGIGDSSTGKYLTKHRLLNFDQPHFMTSV